jgi:hypothetical protein
MVSALAGAAPSWAFSGVQQPVKRQPIATRTNKLE